MSTLKNRNLLNFEQVTHYPLFSIAGIEYGSFINKKEVFFAFTMEDVRQLEEVSSSSGPQMLAFGHMCPKATQSKSHEQRTRSVLTFMTRREGNKFHYLETTGYNYYGKFYQWSGVYKNNSPLIGFESYRRVSLLNYSLAYQMQFIHPRLVPYDRTWPAKCTPYTA